MTRTFRTSVLILPLILASVVPPAVQAITLPDSEVSWRMESLTSDELANRDFSSGFHLFYAGPDWFLNALSNPRSRNPFVASFIYDSAGDRLGSENGYVGTLRDVFDAGVFGNITFATGAGGFKTSTVLISSANTPYYYAGAGDANWGTDGTWGPGPSLPGTTGFPNGAGDSALNFQEINGHVIQNVSGGVTVGLIDNLPTTAGNSGQAVSWTITTQEPIMFDSNTAGPAQINNSQAVGNSSLTINTTTANGLRLLTNLAITNANPGGLVTISAPISDVTNAHTVTTIGPGTTILSGANTYQGGTTVSSGTLLVNNTSGSGTGSGATQVNNNGKLGGSGFIVGGDATINDGGIITGGTNGAVGTLTLTVPALNFASGSIYQVDLGGASADRLTLTGALNITLGATLNFNSISGLTQSSYILATYDSWNNVEFLAPTVPNGYELIYGPASLTLSEIPEPSTWIGGALAFAAVGFTQRRRIRNLIWQRATL
ncbi:MAG: fibronectin-binding autotransporter adhesin [Verrucomicrobiota bacterium]|jgi:autotransporter-associated beta strand protein